MSDKIIGYKYAYKPKIWKRAVTFKESMGIPNKHCFWTDGINQYFSRGGIQLIYDKNENLWKTKTWTGFSPSNDYQSIWSDGTDTYYSYNSNQYVLNKSTGTWESKTWNGFVPNSSWYIWSDGTDFYYSDGSNQYVLNKSTATWEAKTWNGVTELNGSCVWKDGDTIYYSLNKSDLGTTGNYVLNKDTATWEAKTWNGLTEFYGKNVWSDGTDTYYSNGNGYYGTICNYKLNRDTDTWEEKSWPTLDTFCGYKVWSDGVHIYYDNYGDDGETYDGINGNYILNKATGSWEPSIRYRYFFNNDQDIIYPTKNYIWSDKINTYYMHANTTLMLADIEHGLWIDAHFTGEKPDQTYNGVTYQAVNWKDKASIWTDGTNFFCSIGDLNGSAANDRVFSPDDHRWNWANFSNAGVNHPLNNDGFFWTDGTDYYYHQGGSSLVKGDYIIDKTAIKVEDAKDHRSSDKVGKVLIPVYEDDVLKPIFNQIDIGLTGISFNRKDIWYYEGEAYYCTAQNGVKLKFDKQNKQWVQISNDWSFPADCDGRYIWQFNDEYFYSLRDEQYKLNKQTKTWEPVEWDSFSIPQTLQSIAENINFMSSDDNFEIGNKCYMTKFTGYSGTTPLTLELAKVPVYAKDLNEYLDKHGLATVVEQVKSLIPEVPEIPEIPEQPNEFVGTQAEWDALTPEEQNAYDKAYIKKEGDDTPKEYIGSEEAWDALTAEEQNAYDKAYFV